MIKQEGVGRRQLKSITNDCDLVVIGGGMAGTCCAITAARAGIKVTLIQDRPVLGGNASSEVRLWILGATSHIGNNNRWAREGGVIDEILVENLFRNPEGNPFIFDSILLEKVSNERNITLLLNTTVINVEKEDSDKIRSLQAFCSQNSTLYNVDAPLFCDASGDGIVGFMAGAAFRMGAESKKEFGEKLAPGQEYGELLGHTIYFYSKDVGKPVKFIPPKFALKDITKIPRFRSFNSKKDGCHLWWIEYGGRLDTIHDSEKIKWELWKVVYGVWNYIKNSGKFPDAETLTLEWIGPIPGKREGRRFEGDHMLIQQDIVEQTKQHDAVSFGGWAIDLHPADGVFSKKPPCNQWHSKGVYQIPYRCFYSRNIRNLFLAGRIISASHVAFGSTRVQATCAHNAQAVGIAAAQCIRNNLLPPDLVRKDRIKLLQRDLLRTGQYIPGLRLIDDENLAAHAKITASSSLKLAELKPDGPLLKLDNSWAMMLPVSVGPMPKLTFLVDVQKSTPLRVELRSSSRLDNHTPDVILKAQTFELPAGVNQKITVDFDIKIDQPRYVFFTLMANKHVSVHCSNQRVTGILALTNQFDRAVATSNLQKPDEDIGIETLEFWRPLRRPAGHNFSLTIDQPLDVFKALNLVNGIARPVNQPNAWVADYKDSKPAVTLSWDSPQTIGRIELAFDTDFDHPLESAQMGHPERVIPFCVRSYRVSDGNGNLLAECKNNHQTGNTIVLANQVITKKIIIETDHPVEYIPAALFAVRCYSK